MNDKIIFLSFGSSNYKDVLKRIEEQALDFDFDEICCYDENYLKSDTDFWEKNKDFIETNKRGYGYWLWKPYLILKILNRINDGDILIYADCGCELNVNAKYVLEKLIEKAKKKIILVTSASSNDIKYSKSDLTNLFELERETLRLPHMQQTYLIIKKCELITKIYKDMYEMIIDNYNLINDNKSIIKNEQSFIDHRHDQSIFNMFMKKYNLINYDLDPSCYGYYPLNLDNAYNKIRLYPIITLRNRTGERTIKNKIFVTIKYDEQYNTGDILYQIATAFHYANLNKSTLYVYNLNKYFKDYNIEKKNSIFRNVNTRKIIDETKLVTVNNTDEKYTEFINLNNFFTNYNYFDINKELIKKYFSVNEKYKNYIIEKYPYLENNNIASIFIDKNIDVNFIEKAIKHMILHKEVAIIIVFTDDKNYCENVINKKDMSFIYPNENEMVQIFMMSIVKKNIVTNSLSFWGAYLNINNDSCVISSNYVTNKEWIHIN